MGLTTPSASPGITVREIDLTGVAPNVDTSIAGFVGAFKWGPVGVPTTLGNEADLASKFGIPDTVHARDYFSCSQFLKYSGNLVVTRQVTTTSDVAQNATDSATALTIKNEDDWDAQSPLPATVTSFTAKYPGELGNSIKIEVFSRKAGDADSVVAGLFVLWPYSNRFSDIPGTSAWCADQPLVDGAPPSNDEIHIAIVDVDGLISGTKGTVLETFAFVSVAPAAKTADKQSSNYVGNILNNQSNYVWFKDWARWGAESQAKGDAWGSNPATTTAATNYALGNTFTLSTSSYQLGTGVDSNVLITSDYNLAWDLYADVDTMSVQLLIAPGMADKASQNTVVNYMTAIAGTQRKDCLVLTSPDYAAITGINKVDDSISTADQFVGNLSYLTVDNNWLRVYDKYNDAFILVPAASSTAGILAFADYNYGPWYSPAGEKRGAYAGVSGLAYSPTKVERDKLYKKGINPIVQFPGRGTLLFGDKTKLTRPSAFDRIPTRRLFLAIEASIAIAARNFLFELNDEFTRSEFVAVIEPLLREIQARRGIQDYRVQCDDVNNTPATIDRNELVASVFIKPARSIYFITINFVATRTGADFDELVSSVQF